jgi:hypothetical protein
MFKKYAVVGVGLLCGYSAFGEVSERTPQGRLSIEDNVLFLNGKEVKPKIEGDFSLSIEQNLAYKNGNAILLMNNSGGTACPVQYRWVIVTPDSIKQTPQFGSCSDLPKVTVDGDRLTVAFPRYRSAPKSTVVYDGVTITDNGKALK